MVGRSVCSVAKSDYSLTELSSVPVFITIISSVLIELEGLCTQTQTLGNHEATTILFAVTTWQLLGEYE